MKNPAGIICDAGGNVIVVDSGNDRLQVFTPDGQALTQCGRSGSGEGEFNKPWGITLDNEGNIYVADWKNHRVQKLSPSVVERWTEERQQAMKLAPEAASEDSTFEDVD